MSGSGLHSAIRLAPALEWALAYGLALAALTAPAAVNGFPVVYFDTGGYVARAFELDLAPGRSLFYGLFLAAASLGWTTAWGPVALQALMTVWTLHLAFRTAGLQRLPLLVAGAAVLLSIVTGAAWYVAQWMPDILTPLLVLALWLLAFQGDGLARTEKAGLGAVVMLAVVCHMAALALALGLLAVAAAALLLHRRGLPVQRPALVTAAVPVLAALLAMPVASWALTGRLAYTPGGVTFVFSRLVQDGLIARFLDEHCPSPAYRLCAWRDRMPTTADAWIWYDQSPFWLMGAWDGAEPELQRIAILSLRDHPGAHAAAAARALRDQLVRVGTGDGLGDEHVDTRWRIPHHLPQFSDAFLAADQQRGAYTAAFFDRLNSVHRPVGWLASLIPVALLGAGLARRRPDWVTPAAFLLLALLGNAFICGVLSNPHDRYQNRIVWLGLLPAAAMLAYRRPL